jgi:protein-S-isoprenylcysteine O-methyltransferase Ste14
MIEKLTPGVVCFFVGYGVFVAIRGRYDRGLGHPQPDAIDALTMVTTGLGMIVAPLLYVLTPWFDAFGHQAASWLQIGGVSAMVCGLWLFWRAHADLGSAFSRTLGLREDHALVTHGVYRVLRHPMYAAIWLVALSQALLLPNWLAGVAGLIGFLPMYVWRAPREEALLSRAFGESYASYARSTPRLFPSLWRARS